MSKKIVVQTGAKTHDGGFKAGFARVAYHEPIAGMVTSEPIQPARSGMRSAIISLNQFDLFMKKV